MCLVRPTNLSIERATYQRVLTDCNILRFYGQEGLSHRRFISYLLTSLDRALFFASRISSIVNVNCTLFLYSHPGELKLSMKADFDFNDNLSR